MIYLSDIHTTIPQHVYDLSEKGLSKFRQRTDIEFLKLLYQEDMWTNVQNRANEIRKNYDQMVVVGIGGSSLGASMLYQALFHYLDRKVFFFENVDGLSFWHRIQRFQNDKKTHWVIISKSGHTVETLAQTQFLHQILAEHRIKLSQHTTVITEKGDHPLYRWAVDSQSSILKIPKTLVGRYSVLSPVGLLPIAFAGGVLKNLKTGAIDGLNNKDLVRELTAQTYESWQRKEWITLIWTYADHLRGFGLWLQQLWSESLAKAKTRQGQTPLRVSTPLPLMGTYDQHSILQQIAEGFPDKFVWFIRSRISENFGPRLHSPIFNQQNYLKNTCLGTVLKAQLKGTQDLLNQKKIPSFTLVLDEPSALVIGELIMVLQLMVGSLGEILDINAFDQPGVDFCKILTRKYLVPPHK